MLTKEIIVGCISFQLFTATMFLAYALLMLELKRNGCWKDFLQYRKVLRKKESHSLRIEFLENCLKASIIPKFLKFRIPTNGCFDDKAVLDFQLRLLRKELYKAKGDWTTTVAKLEEKRDRIKQKLHVKL